MRTRGACSPTSFPPPAQWQSITPVQARTLLRRVLQRWGLPARVQVDNGHPWGLNKGLPPDLALWLLGLGVGVTWIPPGQPQKNGTIERDHGVMKLWADPATCRTRVELQRRLERECLIQRERYPAIAGRSRMEAYPDLRHSGRPYDPEREAAQWDLARVDQVLSAGVYYRRANARGAIWLYGMGRSLGRAHRGKEVCVRFDPTLRQWVVSDQEGQELKRLAADELSRPRILSLTVGHKRPDRPGSKRG
jgi:hypothetical protein